MKRGVPALLAPVTLTAQQASIGTTTLVDGSNAAGGTFRISIIAEITQAATTSSSLVVTIGYTNNGAAVTTSTNAVNANTVGANSSQVGLQTIVFSVPAILAAITYATTYASVGGTPMQYALKIIVEHIG